MTNPEVKARTKGNKIKNNAIELVHTNKLTLIDYDKAKSQILTELYLSTEFKNKIRKVIVDKQVESLKNLYEDVVQEVMIELSKKDAQYLFEEYVKNRGNIMALAITIAKSFFRKNPAYPDYPNKSIVHRINFHSTMNGKADWVSPVDIDFDEDIDSEHNGCTLSDGGLQSTEYTGGTDSTVKVQSALERLKSTLNDKEVDKLNQMIKFLDKKTSNPNTKKYAEFIQTNGAFIETLRERLVEMGINSYTEIFN